jgi:2,5-furandicarboxylate decarboxylase 1
MTLRSYLRKVEGQNRLVTVTAPISKFYDVAGVLKKLEPGPVMFENVRGSAFRVVGNLFCTKAAFADYFDILISKITPRLLHAIEDRTPPNVVETAPCQEVVVLNPDLDDLPILMHCRGDGGNYISSGVWIAKHPQYGQNMDFHRAMQISKTAMAVRVVKGRHFDLFLQDLKEMDVAICVGNSPSIMAAAAISVGLGLDEMHIANALEPMQVVHAKTVDVLVPAESEFVLEGTIYANRRHAEGPFVDLTETQDIVRDEPVFVVKAITHRRDAIWHALLPGALEHKLLMGMPREPTIFREVNTMVDCLDVNVNPGGASWLHAIIQIDKQNDDDGPKAIEAAFAGHRSCKHVFVVDKDIDIYNPLEVEWAMATRFQGDRDLIIKPRSPGSSLDPSAETDSNLTTRVGFDLTKPLASKGKTFEKVAFPEVDLGKYLKT